MPSSSSSRPTRLPVRRAVAVVTVAAGACAGLVAAAPAPARAASSCPAVDAVFARGTFESQGLGSVGGPFTTSLASDLSGVTVSTYAVVYAAAANQSSSGAGSTDLVDHVESVAASCPSTKFVLGGYSQGASVIDKALGISIPTGGTGTALPASLASKVAAVVVFGNPLGLQRETIETASPVYGARAKSYCNTGDPVCGNGSNTAAHLQYVSNGSSAAGAQFAATKVKGG